MKEAGFDKQCLLLAPGTIPQYLLGLETNRFLCSAWNDSVAGLMKEHDEFIGVAQIPSADVDAAINETERAVHDLGFRAIQVHGTWGSKNMEDFEWWPFYEKLEKLDVPMWYHGTGAATFNQTFNPHMPGRDQLVNLPRVPAFLLGFLWQAQRVLTGLIFGGVLEKYPKLKMVLTECNAGWIPFFLDWLDLMYDEMRMEGQARLHYISGESWLLADFLPRKKPSESVLRNFYFGICSPGRYEIDALLPILINKAGLEKNLMIQTDFSHAHGSMDIVERIRIGKDVSEEAKDRICGRNAADVLRIKWVPESRYDRWQHK
jgi:predicted TIM-barrel fold metal-dependent hydrolase